MDRLKFPVSQERKFTMALTNYKIIERNKQFGIEEEDLSDGSFVYNIITYDKTGEIIKRNTDCIDLDEAYQLYHSLTTLQSINFITEE